jgi:hypothetical protein
MSRQGVNFRELRILDCSDNDGQQKFSIKVTPDNDG